MARIDERLARLDQSARPGVRQVALPTPETQARALRAQRINAARNQARWHEQERAQLQAQRDHWSSISEFELAAHFQARRQELGHLSQPVDALRLIRLREDLIARADQQLARLDTPPQRPTRPPRATVLDPQAQARALRAQQINAARNQARWHEQERAQLQAQRDHWSALSTVDLRTHFEAQRQRLGHPDEPVDTQRLAQFRHGILARIDARLARLDDPPRPVVRRVWQPDADAQARALRQQQANIVRNEQIWREQEEAQAAAHRAEVQALSDGLDGDLAIALRDNVIVLHGVDAPTPTVPLRPARRTTIVVDPSVGDPNAVRRLIDGLPATRTRALTVEFTSPPRPLTEAEATGLADQVLGGLPGRAALVLPADALPGRPPQGRQVVPVDAGNQVTFPELARRFYLHPADRPAPVRTPFGLEPGDAPGTYRLADGWELAQTPDGLQVRPAGTDRAPVVPLPNGRPRIIVGEPDLELPPAVRLQVDRLLQQLPEDPAPQIVEHGPDPRLVALSAGLSPGYRLTAAPGGVVLHREGANPAPATVAEAVGHAVPGGLTVVVDASVTDLRVVQGYLAKLPGVPDRLVTVALPRLGRPYPPARAIRLASWLGRAATGPLRVLYPMDALNERPEPDGRLIPINARGAATFPEFAGHVTVLPEHVPPPTPHLLPPAGGPGVYHLLAGPANWVVEQAIAGLWVRPAAFDGPMPAATGRGAPRVVIGGPGVALSPIALALLSRALAPILPPGTRPEWHVEVSGRPPLDLPADVHMRQTPAGIVLYQGDAPAQAALDLLPAGPEPGELAVVVDASVAHPARLAPLLDALLATAPAGSGTRPVLRLAGPRPVDELAALAAGRGEYAVPAAGLSGPPPGAVPVDALNRVTFPALARQYQTGTSGTPYGLDPAGPETYRLPAGWLVGQSGADLWVRPADATGAPAVPAGDQPRLVVGVPGVPVPPEVLAWLANATRYGAGVELLAPAGPQAAHRPLPAGVRAISGVGGLFVLPGPDDAERAVLNAYAAGAGLSEQIAEPATMLVVNGEVDREAFTVKTAAGPITPVQLARLLVAMPAGLPTHIVFTDPNALAAGSGGYSFAQLVAGIVPVSVLAPGGPVELTDDWRLAAGEPGWTQLRGDAARQFGTVLTIPAAGDGAETWPAPAPSPAFPPVPSPSVPVAPAEGQGQQAPAPLQQPVVPSLARQPVVPPPVQRTAPGPASLLSTSDGGSSTSGSDDSVPTMGSTAPTSAGSGVPFAKLAAWQGWQRAGTTLSPGVAATLLMLGRHAIADDPGMSLPDKLAMSAGVFGDDVARRLAAVPVEVWRVTTTDQPGEQADQTSKPADPTGSLLTWLADALGQGITLVGGDGDLAKFMPAGQRKGPDIVLVEDGAALLGTVRTESVPALLAPAGGGLVLRPVGGAASVALPPDALPDDVTALRDLPGLLAAVTGAKDVRLPDAPELPARLRGAVRGDLDQVSDGPGLRTLLAGLRTAIGAQARPVPPPVPVEWSERGTGSLTDFQVQRLTELGRAAVVNPVEPNAFFNALIQAGEHDQPRLLGLAALDPAEVRAMFGTLLQADLAAAGRAWPLLGAGPAELLDHRAALLSWVGQLAAPGSPPPELTPEVLARAVADLFGVRVVLIEPNAVLPEVAPSTGGPDPAPLLHLVIGVDGYTMATVQAGTPGTVVAPYAESSGGPTPPTGGRPPISSNGLTAPFEEIAPAVVYDPAMPDDLPGDPMSIPPKPAPVAAQPLPSPVPPEVPPQQPLPQIGDPADLDPLVYPMGIPKTTVPYLRQVVRHVQELAARHRITVSPDAWTALPQRLLSNYRAIAHSGLVVPLGKAEVLFHLNPHHARVAYNPAASTVYPVEHESIDDRDGRDAASGRFFANQSTQGTFQTGGVSQTSSGTASAFRARAGIGVALGLDPYVVQVAKFGFSVGGTANRVDRSTGASKDAEAGHVEDTRDPSTLLQLDTDWTIKFRTRPRQRWDDVETTRPDVSGVDPEQLFLWVPDHYLGRPGPQLTASTPVLPSTGATIKQERTREQFLRNLNRIPDTFFASGVTGLPELYDQVMAKLTEAGVKADVGGMLRNQLMQGLWNLDTHLDTAINSPIGYRFTLTRRGRQIAEVTIHTERTPITPTRVGAASDKAHLEKVRTAIAGHSSGFNLGNQSSGQISGEVDLVPVPGVSLGASAYAAWTWDNNDGLSAGRNGLWVLVSRFSGFTSAYNIGLIHRATVTVRNRPGYRSTPTAPVYGQALLRVPDHEAFAHGFPVDRAALKSDPGPRSVIPFAENIVRGAGPQIPARNVKLPAHVLNGHGVGQALVKVDRHVVDELLAAVIPQLQRHGFIPSDLARPFLKRQPRNGKLTKTGAVSTKLDNLFTLYKMISGDGLDSHYDDIHQDGMSFTLRRRSGGVASAARITITAQQELDTAVDKNTGNSVHFQRRTNDFHVVNLAMGLDVAGQSAGGGQKMAIGARAGFGFTALPHLRGLSTGVEFDRSISASESATTITNMPQLMEYAGKEIDEFRLRSRYTITIDYGDENIPQWSIPIPVNGDALVHILPYFNLQHSASDPSGEDGRSAPVPDPAIPVPDPVVPAPLGMTAKDVLDQAVVYYLDTSGVLRAARQQESRFTRPGKAADQEIVNFTGNINMTAHFKEILRGQYTTDTFFEPGIIRNELAGLSIAADLHGSTFVGATPDQYVLGKIKLMLTQAAQNTTRAYGVSVNALDVAGGSAMAAHHLTGLSGEVAGGHRWGWSETRGLRQTGGKEFLELNFQRAYAFRTTVDFTVQGVHEKRAKVLPNKATVQAPQTVAAKEMVYLLSEPDALERYAEGKVPLPTSQLLDVFQRWQTGETRFSSSVLARVLARWARDGVADGTRVALLRSAWATELARKHNSDEAPIRDQRARETFMAAFPDDRLTWNPRSADPAEPSRDARPTYIPPYLTGRGPKALGHAGFHSLRYDNTDKTTFDLVYETVQKVAPGLLGKRGQDWAATGPQVWWRSLASAKPVIGRLQGGLDALQSMLSAGRDQPMIEDMLSANGMKFYLVNPIGWLLSDVVELTLRMELVSTPRISDFIPDNGLENYGHGYTELSHSRGFDSTSAFTIGKVNFAGVHGTSGAPEVHLGGGQHRSSRQADENFVEQTVYDWSGHYRAAAGFRLIIDARRVKMAGRGINNQLAGLVRRRAGDPAAVQEIHGGEVVLKLPRGLTEAAPLHGPQPLTDLSPLPELPADGLVAAALLDDLLPAANRLMRAVFGPEADTRQYRTSLSLPMLLSRSHLGNHLLKALGGKTHVLANDLFLPGYSSDRAKLSLTGDLYDLRVIAPIVNATGTGRYAKYLSTSGYSTSNDLWNVSYAGGVDQSGVTQVNDPQHADQAWATNVADGSTGASRQAAPGNAGGGASNPRREQHIKQQGPVYLVQASGRFLLEAQLRRHEITGDPIDLGTATSEPISGDVFLELFADEVEEMLRQLLRRTATATTGLPPAWPAGVVPERQADLDELLAAAAADGANAWEAPREVARQLRQPATRQQPLRLTTSTGGRALATHIAVANWEIDRLRGPAAATRRTELRASLPGLRNLAGPGGPRDGAGQIATRTTEIINRVNEASGTGAGPRTLPRAVPVLALDPLFTARQIAYALNTYVQVEEARPGLAGPVVHRIDPTGRIYQVDDQGAPFTARQAFALLPEELRAQVLAAETGLDWDDVEQLYQNSWTRQQTFEQALRAELRRVARLVPPPVPPPSPVPPSTPEESRASSPLSFLPRGTRTHPPSAAGSAAYRGGTGIEGGTDRDNGTELDNGADRADGSAPRESLDDLAIRRSALIAELGWRGYPILLEAAAGIIRRSLGVADNEVFTDRYPSLLDIADDDGEPLSGAKEIELVVGMEALLDVAEARLIDAPRAEARAREVGRTWGIADDDVPPPAFDDPNQPRPNQLVALRDLGRYASWTPPDGDCWFTSVIRAARNSPDQSGIIGELADMTPTELRRGLATLLDNSDELREELRANATDDADYDRFRAMLDTPTQWGHHLFDDFFARVPDLLRIRLVVTNVDGTPVSFGPPDAPVLYVVRTPNHYLPALRLPGGYLASQWLAADQPGTAVTLEAIAGDELAEALRMTRWSPAMQAVLVQSSLEVALPGLVVDDPTEVLPADLSSGTRIWLIDDEGRVRAAWLGTDDRLRVFDPQRATIGELSRGDLADWVGARPHQFVVVRPAEMPPHPNDLLVPAPVGASPGGIDPQHPGQTGETAPSTAHGEGDSGPPNWSGRGLDPSLLPTSDDVVIVGGRYDPQTDRLLLDGQLRDPAGVAWWIRQFTPWSPDQPRPVVLVAGRVGEFARRVGEQLGNSDVIAATGRVFMLPGGALLAGGSVEAGGEFVPDAGETYGWWLYTGDGGTVPLGHELNTILADQGFVVRPPRVAVTEPAASAQVIPEGTHPGLTARGLPAGSFHRFVSPRDTVAHEQAANAVPLAVGWQTLVAHLRDGQVYDGDGPVSGAELIARLELREGGFAGLVMVVCDAATVPPGGTVAPAAELHAATGNRVPILAPTQRTTSVNGDVLSALWTVDEAYEVRPEAVGSWILWRDGEPYDLGVASLSEALARLEVAVVAGGPAPAEPVSFFDSLTTAQTATLNALHYAVPARVDTSVDSFYHALLAMAGPQLAAMFPAGSGALTANDLRAVVADALAADLARPDSRYAELVPPGVDHAALLTDVRDPVSWSHQESVLVPHVAADVFGLDLGVIGALGHAEAVGDPSSLRRRDPGNDPFLLVNIGDRFLRAIPQARPDGPVQPRELRAARPAGAASPWTRALSAAERRQVDQAAADAVLPPAAVIEAMQLKHRTVFDALRPRLDTEPAPETSDELAARLVDGLADDELSATVLAEVRAVARVAAWIEATGTELKAALAQHAAAYRDLPGAGGSDDTALGVARLVVLAERANELAAAYRGPVSAAGGTGGSGAVRDGAASGGAGDGAAVASVLLGIRAAAEADPEARQAAGSGGWQRRTEVMRAAIRRQLSTPDNAGLVRRLADAAGAHRLALNNRAPVAEARRQGEQAQREHEEARLDALRDEARALAEWHIRQDNAVAEILVAGATYRLPQGFGAIGASGRPQYPMGRDGQIVRVGNAHTNDFERLADLVVDGYRTSHPRYDAELRAELRRVVLEYLIVEGSQAFLLRLLGAGLDLSTTIRVDRRELADSVHITLDLGDLSLARQATGRVTEHVPIGQVDHAAVESDHESTSGVGRGASSNRGIGVTANVLTAFGGLPNKVFSFQGGLGISGSGSNQHRFGNDAVSATKRLFEFGGERAYFDFLAPVLSVQTAVPADAAPLGTERPVSVRTSFAAERLTARRAGESILPSSPQAPLLGITDPTEARAVVDGAQNVQLQDKARRVARAQHRVFHIAESVSGLDAIRNQVAAALRDAGRTDSELLEGNEFYLSELSVLRMFSDITGPGSTSPMFAGTAERDRMHLTVRAGLVNAQAVSVDPVPMKEESQRFVNFSEGKSQGSSITLTLPSARFSHTFGNLDKPMGGSTSAAAQADVSLTASSNRAMNANSGSGHISGLVYQGESVLYRMTFAMTVDLALPGTRLDAPPAARGQVTAYVRVPVHQRARFEAILADQARNAPTNGPYPIDTDQVTLPADATDEQRAEDAREAALVRHPPVELAAGVGTGFSAIDSLPGAEDVLPTLVEMIREADAPAAWARGWSAMELAFLRTQLASRFTQEGLVNWGDRLFQPGGLTAEVARPARDGIEIITATVRARLVNPTAPLQSGRLRAIKQETMPSAFAGSGGSESVGRGWGTSVQANATVGLGDGSAARQLGITTKWDYARGTSENLDVRQSGFMLEAILYSGPGRFFRYDVQYDLDIRVRHEAGPVAVGWLELAARWARSLPAQAVAAFQAEHPPVADATMASSRSAHRRLAGGVTFVIVEKLAPRALPDPATLARTGAVTFHRPVRAADAVATGLAAPTGVAAAVPAPAVAAVSRRHLLRRRTRIDAAPDLREYLSARGHVHTPLNLDDQVTGVKGSDALRAEVERMLERVGIDRNVYGHIPSALTSKETLAASQVRGPSVIQQSFTVAGLTSDRRARVTIAGYPRDMVTGDEDIPIFQMHVAEGNGAVAATHTSTRKHTFTFSAGVNTLDGTAGNGTQTGSTPLNISRDFKSRSKSDTTAYTPTSGRLTQSERVYRERTADMVWHIAVVSYDESMGVQTNRRVSHSIAEVERGITFLRTVTPAVDPRATGMRFPAVPANAVSLLRTDQPPADPAQVSPHATAGRSAWTVPTMPAFPGSTTRVPIEPLVPPTAAPERLLPLPNPAGAYQDPRKVDVSGEGDNQLLQLVRRLLPVDMLEYDGWSVTRTDGRGLRLTREVPSTLRNLLNVGSMQALLDSLVSTGLVLTGIRSGFLHNERVQIVLRATRDPDNHGYAFLEHVPSANVSRYWFRLNTDAHSVSKSHSHAEGTGESTSETPSPRGRFGSVSGTPSITASAGSSDGRSLARTDAARDTFFMAGPADRYAGEIEISATVTRTTLPSRVLNTLTLGSAGQVAGAAQRSGQWQGHVDRPVRTVRRRDTGSVRMIERVLIPTQLLAGEAPRTGVVGRGLAQAMPAAVTAVPVGSTAASLGGQPLPITRTNLINRDAVNFGFDPAKLRVLFDQAMARFSGAVPDDSGTHGLDHTGLVAQGSRAQDALHYMMSYQMFSRQLENMLSQQFRSPKLVREGLINTTGRLGVEIELMNPQVGGHVSGWLESVDYGFAEFNRNQGASQGLTASVGGGTREISGDPNRSLPANSHDQQSPQEGLNVSLGYGDSRSGFGVLKTMPRAVAKKRTVPWQLVTADAIVTLTLKSRHVRHHYTRVAFHVRNALQLGVAPELALRLGLLNPHGVPLPSGVIFPVRGAVGVSADTDETLAAAFGQASTDGAFAIHARLDRAGKIVIGDRGVDVATFVRDHLPGRAIQNGRTLVLVGSGLARVAPALAQLTGQPVVATPDTVRITPDRAVLAIAAGAAVAGMASDASAVAWGRWYRYLPGVPDGQALGADLSGSLSLIRGTGRGRGHTGQAVGESSRSVSAAPAIPAVPVIEDAEPAVKPLVEAMPTISEVDEESEAEEISNASDVDEETHDTREVPSAAPIERDHTTRTVPAPGGRSTLPPLRLFPLLRGGTVDTGRSVAEAGGSTARAPAPPARTSAAQPVVSNVGASRSDVSISGGSDATALSSLLLTGRPAATAPEPTRPAARWLPPLSLAPSPTVAELSRIAEVSRVDGPAETDGVDERPSPDAAMLSKLTVRIADATAASGGADPMADLFEARYPWGARLRDAAPDAQQFVPSGSGAGWRPVESWEQLADALGRVGHGAFALVRVADPAQGVFGVHVGLDEALWVVRVRPGTRPEYGRWNLAELPVPATAALIDYCGNVRPAE